MTGEMPNLQPCPGHTPDEVEALARLRRALPDIEVMLTAGLFDFKDGNMTVHRDHTGKLMLITDNIARYRAPKISTPHPPKTAL